jgi:hypothetical protein
MPTQPNSKESCRFGALHECDWKVAAYAVASQHDPRVRRSPRLHQRLQIGIDSPAQRPKVVALPHYVAEQVRRKGSAPKRKRRIGSMM